MHHAYNRIFAVMDIEKRIKSQISEAFMSLYAHTLAEDEVKLQPTRKEFAGSHTFVTFPYTRVTKKSPQDSAEEVGIYLKNKSTLIRDFNVVKGFLNLEIDDTVWLEVFKAIAEHQQEGVASFSFQELRGEKVMVEFSSPNTNKPLHLGHLRNNFLGYSVSRILEACGYSVRKVNLVNDRGIHICKSMLAYQKFGQGETPATAGVKGDHLVGQYYVKFDQEYKKEVQELVAKGMEEEQARKEASLLQEAQDMLQKWEQGDPEVAALWKTMNQWVYEGFNATYENIGVSFDQIYHESDTYLLGKNIVEEGLSNGIFFKKEDGSVWVDLTDEGLDQKLLLRSDGTSVYMTQDLGTADLRHHDYPFDKLVYVVGNEQDYHFEVLFKILKKLGRPYADGLYHLSYGMVDLPSGRMKSREGTVVDADDLVDEMVRTAKAQTEELGKIEGFTEAQAQELYKILGLGALKYFLLKVDPKKRMLFNPEESVQFQGNTAPFIQYTYARISAILRKAKETGIEASGTKAFSGLTGLQPSEREVIRLLHDFPNKLAAAGAEYSPSVVAQYVYELAKEYNRFYTEVSIFNEKDAEALAFRVVFSAAVAEIIKYSMALLGIQVPERM